MQTIDSHWSYAALGVLHESIEYSVINSFSFPIQYVSLRNERWNKSMFHFLPVSYVVDIPKSKNLLNLKRFTQTSSSCQNMHWKNAQFHNTNQAKHRTLGEKKRLLKGHCVRDNSVQELIKSFCMHASTPFFALIFICWNASVRREMFDFSSQSNTRFLSGNQDMLRECSIELFEVLTRISSFICRPEKQKNS